MSTVRYRFGEYALDLATRELRLRGEAVLLPARVFECLICLIENRERAVSRDELVQAVFGRADVSDAQLAQIVLRARRAVGDDGHEQRSIRTVPRFGFRWLLETSAERDDNAKAEANPPYPPFSKGGTAVVPAEPVAGEQAATPKPMHGKRWPIIATVVVVLALVSAFAWRWSDRSEPVLSATGALAPASSGRSILVLPSNVEASDEAAWARLGLMDFVADRLHRAGLPVLSSEAVLGVLREQKQDAASLRRATRAAWIVDSRAKRVPAGWEVDLSASDRDGVIQHGRAQHAELLEAARMAADRLAPALGGSLSADELASPALAERLQRARAAMLANEIETARRILLEAPELQRSQPRLQYQLARVDFRAGEYQRGLATLDQALASVEARRDPVFNARLLNARGAMLIRMERYIDAERAYDRVIASIGKSNHPAELGQALSGRAVAYSLQKKYDLALADLGQARVQLSNMGDALAVARVDANLGILEADRRRPAHGLPYLQKAAEDFKSMGAVNELATTRKMLMAVHLAMLRTDLALAEADRAWAMLPRVRDPSQRAELILARAEVLVAAGRLREAGRLLAMPEAMQEVPSDYGRLEYLKVDLARRAGENARAVTMADAALRAWPADRNPWLRAWTAYRREQAALEADLPRQANALVPSGDDLPARLAAASLYRARGDRTAADAGYRSAIAMAEQAGVPEEVAVAVQAYAPWLLEQGRVTEAGALIGRIAPWAGHDFDVALLQVRLMRAMGQRGQWRAAFERAKPLAGERAIPTDLDPDRSRPSSDAVH